MANNQSAKEIVKAYLDKRAQEDPQFAASYAKPKKNLDECWNFILGEAKKRGNSVCMTDEEVFGLAVHYYDEDDIKINHVNGSARVSSTKPVELTEEEKAEARERAKKAYEAQALKEIQEHNRKRPEKKQQKVESPSLFDL